MPRLKGQPHIDDPKRVGRRLYEARRDKGLSQRALSFPGCTAAYISRIEAGERVPSYQLLLELGRRLDVSASYLATGAEEEQLSKLETADLLLRLGNSEEAEAIYDAASKADDGSEQGRGHQGLGVIAFAAGRLDDALEHLAAAKAVLGERWRLDPTGPEHYVRTLATTGRLEEAIAEAEALLAETPEEEPVTRGRYLVLLANALIDTGGFARATELIAGALADSQVQADPLRLIQLLWSQSRLHTARGEHEIAAQYARRAIAVLEVTEFASYTARARQVLAYVENESGNPEAALGALEQGWQAMVESRDPYLSVIYRLERARALVQLSRMDEARELAAEVLATTEGLGTVDAARANATLAQLLASSGDEERALEVFEIAARELQEIGSPLVRDVYMSWADLLDDLGRRDEAYGVLRRALPTQSAIRSQGRSG
jgi:transcriptional regulator with XRE-family HTH domain